MSANPRPERMERKKAGRKPNLERYREIVRLYESGLSTLQIEQQIGASRDQTGRSLRHYGIRARNKAEAAVLKRRIDRSEVLRRVEAGQSYSQIAAAMECTRTYVYLIVRDDKRNAGPNATGRTIGDG